MGATFTHGPFRHWGTDQFADLCDELEVAGLEQDWLDVLLEPFAEPICGVAVEKLTPLSDALRAVASGVPAGDGRRLTLLLAASLEEASRKGERWSFRLEAEPQF